MSVLFSAEVHGVPGVSVSLEAPLAPDVAVDVVMSLRVTGSGLISRERVGYYILSGLPRSHGEPLMFCCNGRTARLEATLSSLMNDLRTSGIPGMRQGSVPLVAAAVEALVAENAGAVMSRFAAAILVLARTDHAAPQDAFEDSYSELLAAEVHRS